jgi:hypothetical protein
MMRRVVSFTVVVHPLAVPEACPQGDGTRFDDPVFGGVVTLTARDIANIPIPGIIAADIWMVGCTDGISLCGGSGSINADSATSTFTPGYTTISGDLAAGGCDLTGLYVVIQGVIVGCPPTCLSYWVTSPDLNGDLQVSLIDFSPFEIAYKAQPGAYDPCMDFNCDGFVTLPDFAIFGIHWLHAC